jgi:hypothetical protein
MSGINIINIFFEKFNGNFLDDLYSNILSFTFLLKEYDIKESQIDDSFLEELVNNIYNTKSKYQRSKFKKILYKYITYMMETM